MSILMASDNPLQKLIDSFPREMMVVDANANIKLVNKKFATFFNDSDVIDSSLFSHIDGAYLSYVKQAIEDYLQSKTAYVEDKFFKIALLNKGQTSVPGTITINPVGEIEGVASSCFSLAFSRIESSTSKERFYEMVRSQYLEMIFDNTSDAIFLAPISKNGVHRNFIEVNREACDRLGYTKQELLNLNARSINPQANLNRIKAYGEMLQKEGFAIFEAIHTAKNGEHIPVEVHATVVRNEFQDYVLSVVKDLRPLKKSESSQAIFGRLMDYSWNEIYVINSEDLRLKMANEGALKNLGIKKSEIENYRFSDLLVDTSTDQFLDFSQELFSGEKAQLIYETQFRRVNGSVYPVEVRLQLSQSEVPPLLFANVQDISERKKIERRLTYLASYDSLTGLPNRALYMDRLNVAMEACKRQQNLIAILFIDLDGFKQVNDTHGHDIGDLLVREVAKRLTKSTRKSDTVARFGGDEFTIILNNINKIEGVDVVIDKIMKNITEPFLLGGKEILTSPSIGITLYPFNDNDDANELLRQADIAMYHAKKMGKRGYVYYSSELSETEARKSKVESAVQNALKRKELELYFQPRVLLDSGAIVGAEVLLRWQSAELGFVSPVEFIPIMEKTGVIVEVGTWVLRQACTQLRQWMDQGYDFRLSVNVSAKQFDAGGLHELVGNILAETNVPADHLEIEITEGLLIDQSNDAIVALEKLSEQGVSISLDDFGTGYSSLSYLKQFPIDVLKIDRSFVMDLQQNKDSLVIVEAIIGLAKNLGLSVTAEGIEEKWHADFLKARDCDEGQGYYFARPMPKEEMQHTLEYAKFHGLPVVEKKTA
ncbi:MAG TPA: EAL domain-containing protein [Gammaproteobacteria bacterium]|nr:EAL domain-containing protein [Gammaproteobacteria bacterium]